MYYRVLKEEGKYVDAKTGEPRNLLSGLENGTADGINPEYFDENGKSIGFKEFDSDEAAAEFFGLIKVDYNETNS